MKSDFDTLKNMITCLYCGEIFKKQNKALILKCAHSICQFCHQINLHCLTCLICKVKYVGKDNMNHPINFLLVEFLEKEEFNELINKYNTEHENKLEIIDENKKENNGDNPRIYNNIIDNKNDNEINDQEKKYYCTNCNLYLRNDFHFDNSLSKCKFSKKSLLDFEADETKRNIENKKIEEEYKNLSKDKALAKDSEALMKKYNEFNNEINELYELYIKNILINYIEGQKILIETINNNDVIQNLIISGILPENHFNKLLKFMMKYNKNKQLIDLIKNFSKDIIPESNEIQKKNFNKSEQFLAELNNIEKIHPNFKTKEYLSEYFFFKKVMENFKNNVFNNLTKLESIFTLNNYDLKDIETDEKRLKNEEARKICEIYNRDMMQNLISEISNDINFSEQKDISNIKYSYFFIKKPIKEKNGSFKEENLPIDFIQKNNLNLIVFDPLTESLKKHCMEALIDEIQELYEKYKINYSKECLKIKNLKNFDFDFDQFGNIFIFGGYFKKAKNNINIFSNKENENQIKYQKEDRYEFIPNNKIFKINPFKKKFKIFYELSIPKYNSASIIINKAFFFLGGKTFEKYFENLLNLKAYKIPQEEKPNSFGNSFKSLNLQTYSMTTLKEYPLELNKKPLILNHVYENIFVCEDIKNFSFYNLKSKKWKKSQIFYATENIRNISNFIGFNFNKQVILLGGTKNILRSSPQVKIDHKDEIDSKIKRNEEDIIEQEIKEFNDQILAVEKAYYSISRVGQSKLDFMDLYEKNYQNKKFSEIQRIIYDISYLSDSTYILEYHQTFDMLYIQKNLNLKAGLDFEGFKLTYIDDIK